MDIQQEPLDDQALLSRCLEKVKCEELHQCLLLPFTEFQRITGLSEAQAKRSISLISAQVYPWRENMATVADLRSADNWIFTGDKFIDCCLGGGIRLGSITEIVGESGSGKTQLCMQLAIAAQLPESLGGLDSDVIYISTEGVIHTERLEQMASAFVKRVASAAGRYPIDINPLEYLSRIQIAEYESADLLFHALSYKIPSLLEAGNIKLVIIDSMAAHLRFDDDPKDDAVLSSVPTKKGRSFYKDRTEKLIEIGAKFKEWASIYGCAFVCVNQVSDIINDNNQNDSLFNLRRSEVSLSSIASLDGADTAFNSLSLWRKAPALGSMWSNIIDVRVMLYQRRGLSSSEVRLPGESTNNGNSGTNTKLPESIFRMRRWLECVFSPWIHRSQCEVILDDSGFYAVVD